MVWNSIVDVFRGKPDLPAGQPTKLPPYFPVEPLGCERVSQKLFACLSEEATQKARDMEKANIHKSYYKDIPQPEPDEDMRKVLAEDTEGKLPRPGDNPLDPCREHIAYYQRCCDRALKQKRNWILTEPYRVQEEYRYDNPKSGNNPNLSSGK